MDPDRLEFLAQIASWYYEQGLDQEVIAQHIGRSRSMVSRLLQEAREAGLVEIRVRHPLKTDAALEDRLIKTYRLQGAAVLASLPSDHPTLLRRLGLLGARCLNEWLADGQTIGIGWGTALHEVVRAMPQRRLQGVTVVQLIGATGRGDPLIDGPELARWLAQKLGAAYRLIPAPLIVESDAVARALLQERSVAEALALARRASVALVGVGSVEPSVSSLQRAGYLGAGELAQLKAAGVVGDILARQLNADGQPVETPYVRRVIGLDLAELTATPVVIAVAGGKGKAMAVRAALRGGYVKVMVTDAETARFVLDDP